MRATVQTIQDQRRKRSEIWRSYEKPLRQIVARDTEHQLARADSHGGVVTSELGEEAQRAAAQIVQKRDRAVESLGGSHRAAIVQGHDEMLTEAATAAGALAFTLRQLVAYESEMSAFFHETRQQPRGRAADQDLALALENFAHRIRQIQQAPPQDVVLARVARRVAQDAMLARPDFADLV